MITNSDLVPWFLKNTLKKQQQKDGVQSNKEWIGNQRKACSFCHGFESIVVRFAQVELVSRGSRKKKLNHSAE